MTWGKHGGRSDNVVRSIKRRKEFYEYDPGKFKSLLETECGRVREDVERCGEERWRK